MGPRSKILVVDDLSIFRELEARFLSASGQVFTAASGREALEIARRERPEVVVADFALPDLEGDALTKEIKGDLELQGIAVVLVTNGVDAESRASAVRAGADDVISKPIDRLGLIEVVSRFLRVPVARSLARVPLVAPVRLTHDGGEHEGRTGTLSRGGLFVATELDLATDSEIELAFRLPDSGFEVATSARVVWRTRDAPHATQDPGVGLQFLRMDGATARQIEAFVAERLPRREADSGEAA